MQQGCTRGRSPAVQRATTVLGQLGTGTKGAGDSQSPRQVGRGSLPGDGGTRTPGLRERDWWPQGEPGMARTGRGGVRKEPPRRRVWHSQWLVAAQLSPAQL